MSKFQSSRRFVLSTISFLMLLMLTLSTQPTSASDGRTSVSGNITETSYTVGCKSPLNECGRGTISGSINGTADGSQTTQKSIRNGKAIRYKGTATFTTPQGMLYADTTTILDLATFNATSVFRIRHGTGIYNHTHGILHVSGSALTDPESYTYTGWLAAGDDNGGDDGSDNTN